jgi:hypothetical protein
MRRFFDREPKSRVFLEFESYKYLSIFGHDSDPAPDDSIHLTEAWIDFIIYKYTVNAECECEPSLMDGSETRDETDGAEARMLINKEHS